MSRDSLFVSVFCASAMGHDPAYQAAATATGKALAASGLGLVYGGASVGLMGAVADAALSSGTPVVGVLPAVLKGREIAHPGLTDLIYVDSMHERKALMVERSDAFLTLPGGYGTLDEFFEVMSWAQLGIHSKPCVLVNTQGFFDAMLAFLDRAVQEGFLRKEYRKKIQVVATAEEAVALLCATLDPH